MQVDLSKPIREQLVPLNVLIRQELPGERNPATAARWAIKGLQGRAGERIRLQTWMVGRIRYSSREALAKFLEEVTAARTADQESNESQLLRATDAELAAAGLLP